MLYIEATPVPTKGTASLELAETTMRVATAKPEALEPGVESKAGNVSACHCERAQEGELRLEVPPRT